MIRTTRIDAQRSSAAPWTRLLAHVCSFEVLFILFLFAGRYKADPRFSWIPVDITALFFALSVLAALLIFVLRGFRFMRSAIPLLGFFLAFVVYVLLSLVWTPSQVYASEKALYIATLTFWPLIATSLIIAPDPRRVRRFLVVTVIFSTWLAFETFVVYLRTGGGESLEALGGNYLGIGRAVGLSSLIILVYLLTGARTPGSRLAAAALLGWSLWILLVAGGRGPFLATVLAALLPLLSSMRLRAFGRLEIKRYLPALLLIMSLAGIGMAYLVEMEDTPQTLERLELLTGEDVGNSAETRLYYYSASWQLWAERPIFGYGVGSWPIVMGFNDSRNYPHNLVLEVLVEFGLIGLILIVLFLVFTFRALGRWQRVRAEPWRLLVFMLLISSLVNAMVSGDLPDNRLLFGLAGLAALGPASEVRS